MTAEATFQAVFLAAERYTGAQEDRGLPDALNAVVDFAAADRQEIRQRLADGLPGVGSLSGAGLLAVWFGAGVERGADPKISGGNVVKALIQWCRQPPGDDSPELDENLRTGLEVLGQSAVAHLARDSELLASLRNDGGAVETLAAAEGWSVGAMWVMQLLRLQSGEIVVLHAVDPIGFRVRYENLGNCFHFFTLLQEALAAKMPGALPVRAEVLAVAHGASQEEVYDHAWWHYGQPTSPAPGFESMVFGEMPLDSIDRVDGMQLLLLWAPLVESRSWDEGFFCPHLMAAPAMVSILRELEQREVAQWRQRLGLGDGA